jgi:uncharacterized protein (DUF2141 family)
VNVGAGTHSRRYRFIAAVIILFVLGCAKPLPPPGGPLDEIPPSVLSTEPASGDVGVSLSTPISIRFSERIDRTTIAKALFISPQPATEPKIKVKGDAIMIIPREPLQLDKTYVITMGADVKDAHGVNLAQSVAIAFSTGKTIDSGALSGTVYKEGKGIAGINLALFEIDPGNASMPVDSVKPVYLTQSGDGGKYTFNYLPSDTFYLVAFEDKNKDRAINPSREMVGLPFRSVFIASGSTEIAGLDIRLHMIDTTALGLRSVAINPDGLLKVRFNKVLQEAGWQTLMATARLSVVDTPVLIDLNGGANLAPFPCSDFLLLTGELSFGNKYRLAFDRGVLDPSLPDSSRFIRYDFDAKEITDQVPPALLETIPADNAVNVYPESLLVWRFSEPVDVSGEANVSRLIDQKADTISVFVQSRDRFSYNGQPATSLDYGNNYQLEIDGRLISDRSGNMMSDSIIRMSFTTIGRDTLGQLSGEVQFTDAADAVYPVVISLNPAGTGVAADMSVDPGQSSFTVNLLPGYYTVSAFLDRNSDGRYDYGSVSPYRLAEPFVAPVDTFRVRSRFESTGLVVKF